MKCNYKRETPPLCHHLRPRVLTHIQLARGLPPSLPTICRLSASLQGDSPLLSASCPLNRTLFDLLIDENKQNHQNTFLCALPARHGRLISHRAKLPNNSRWQRTLMKAVFFIHLRLVYIKDDTVHTSRKLSICQCIQHFLDPTCLFSSLSPCNREMWEKP